MGGIEIGDLAEPPRRQALKVTRPDWLFMRALCHSDKKFRNYRKARKRSIRNSRAGR